MQVPPIDKNDFDNWWNAPVGQHIRQRLGEMLDEIKDTALTEEVIRDSIKGGILCGQKIIMDEFLDMNFYDFMGIEEPEKKE